MSSDQTSQNFSLAQCRMLSMPNHVKTIMPTVYCQAES